MMRRCLLVLSVCAGLAAPVRGAELRVGPGEAYATIQSAIDAAIAHGGINDIQVVEGVFHEHLVIRGLGSADWVRLRGGYVVGFPIDPATGFPISHARATTIDGGGTGPVVAVTLGDGKAALDNFTVTGGNTSATGGGGGLLVALSGGGEFSMMMTTVSGNRLSAPDGATGGGMQARLSGRAHLSLSLVIFEGNSVTTTSTSHQATAGGAEIFAVDDSRVEVNTCAFMENEANGALAEVSGLSFEVQGGARGVLRDTHIQHNRSRSDSDATQSALRLGAEFQGRAGVPSLVARGNFVLDNSGQGSSVAQVVVITDGPAELVFGDSLIAKGSHRGVVVTSPPEAKVPLVNLTVSGHRLAGISVRGGGTALVSNTISFDNGVDVEGRIVEQTNLIATDPRFVDAAHDNYQLSFGSPGIDAGTNAPSGGLGPFALGLGHPARIQGRAVDVGAYESSWPTGEGACRLLWPGVDSSTGICRCASDFGLNNFRCAGFGRDLFFLLRIPPPPGPPGGPLPVSWTILPWDRVSGPYTIEVDALIDGVWRAQKGRKPAARQLKQGALAVERYELKLPKAEPTPLRARVTYRRPGEKSPTTVQLDVLLPAQGTSQKPAIKKKQP